LVNTWNSYVRITDDERLLIPAGYIPDGHPKYPTCGHLKIPHPARLIFQ
jgi:hypothetical protein